ncbi:hypothetical protein GCM10023189_10300 [Nibrella saemangeumensis]|uniref:Outer membrane protein beta-barrel domain-containing protein n=1 Tax=Nibrella saemangeumensis TaxID=1084526 RepID=A0ABP8MG54_9BACT
MKTLLALLLFIPALTFGQDTPQPGVVKSVWRAAFIAPGIIHELRLGNRTTLVSEVRMTTYSKVKEVKAEPNKSEYYSSYTINPIVTVGARHFYNFERRLEKGKSIRYNSGNYLMARTRYVLPAVAKEESDMVPIGNGSGFGVEALWGFQRTYRRNFYLNLAIGGGIFQGKSSGAADFTLGYTFPTN